MSILKRITTKINESEIITRVLGFIASGFITLCGLLLITGSYSIKTDNPYTVILGMMLGIAVILIVVTDNMWWYE